MTDPAANRRQMRILAVILTTLWAGTAVAVAAAYRPGGPLDLVVALVCFGPVLVAGAGLAWPPVPRSQRSKVALVWIWIAAVLLGIPVLYGVASTVAADVSHSLVPSAEAAYGGVLAVFAMAAFSVSGWVHGRTRSVVFERRATLVTSGLAVLLTALVGAAFGLVALINDQSLRLAEPASSSYGPTDPDLVPPFCDEPIVLGRFAHVSIRAKSSLDSEDRGRAVLTGRRNGIDEVWSGTWSGPDGSGRTAYLRIGQQAWLDDGSDGAGAASGTWQETRPNPFALASGDELTMDGPPHARANMPRGSIVAEDLGLEVIDGARARHCRTFIDGPTALSSFLPLRWLLRNSHDQEEGDARRWRGEMDWWVFGDGELGRARVEISGSRADTSWAASGVRALLEAELESIDRDEATEVSASAVAPLASTASPSTAATSRSSRGEPRAPVVPSDRPPQATPGSSPAPVVPSDRPPQATPGSSPAPVVPSDWPSAALESAAP